MEEQEIKTTKTVQDAVDPENKTPVDQAETETEPEKDNLWKKIVGGVKKAYRETSAYLEACNDRNELEKIFEKKCAVFTDLSNGKRIRGMTDGAAVKLLADVKFDPLHRYYSEGVTYRLDDARQEEKFEFTAEGNPERIEYYLAPCEIVITPIKDIDAALDEYERLIKAYEPSFPGLYKQAQTDVITRFVDFRKVVAADRRDTALFDEMVTKSVKFAPKAAKLLADIISNIR